MAASKDQDIHRSRHPNIYVGQAGWSINSALAANFDQQGTHLARYAKKMRGVEINSSFYRSHKAATYARWAEAVPENFRFAIKLPRSLTHEARLCVNDSSQEALAAFLDQTYALGDKRGPILMQLPPSLSFDEGVASDFFSMLRACFGGAVVCEPRHPTWFAAAPLGLLHAFGLARVLADPPPCSEAIWTSAVWDAVTSQDLVYVRLHGSPQMYHSPYDESTLSDIAGHLKRASHTAQQVWCILDNTASGAALEDALKLEAHIESSVPS